MIILILITLIRNGMEWRHITHIPVSFLRSAASFYLLELTVEHVGNISLDIGCLALIMNPRRQQLADMSLAALLEMASTGPQAGIIGSLRSLGIIIIILIIKLVE